MRCARCNRLLTDPESIKRGLGPVCAAKVRLSAFTSDLQLDNREINAIADRLKRGGERDYGCNWRYYHADTEQFYTVRISLRYNRNKEKFEVYGFIQGFVPNNKNEFVITETADIREAIEVACFAGPRYTAEADRVYQNLKKKFA